MANSINPLEILFYFSAVTCVFLGSHVIYSDHKSNLNITFFASCMALSLWAIGFGRFFHFTDTDTALSWRRVASAGYIGFYAFLFHFMLILSENDRHFRKKRSISIIYIPAAILLYVFSLSNALAPKQYLMARTGYGWNTLPIYNIWENSFYAYFAFYTALGLLCVFVWGKKSKDCVQKKISRLIFFSFSATFAIGSFTDILANMFFPAKVPQIGPLLAFIPVSVIFFAMTKYGFLLPDKSPVDIDILTSSTRSQVYIYLSRTFMIGGGFILFVHFMFNVDIPRPLLSSFLVLMFGIVIRIANHFDVFAKYMDSFVTLLTCIAIPSITLLFLPVACITVWSMSLLFIVISLVFTKKTALLAVSVSAISTQIVVWLTMPEAFVAVNASDHLGRVCTLAIAIWLAFYINTIYTERLKDNANQIRLQTLVSEISFNFIDATFQNIYDKFNSCLGDLTSTFEALSSCIFIIDHKKRTMSCRAFYVMDASTEDIDRFKDLPLDNYSWSLRQLSSNNVVQLDNISKFSNCDIRLKESTVRQSCESVLLVPILSGKKLLGFLYIDFIHNGAAFPNEHVSILRIISNIFRDTIIKVAAENEIRHMAFYDYLTKLPNRRLYSDKLVNAIAIAKNNKKSIGIIFIDLDSFKSVNDTLGHEGGDLLLKAVSKSLVSAVRHFDTVARFGGDEFLILAENLSCSNEIIPLADEIMSVFNDPFVIKGQEFYISISVGISMYPHDGTTTDSLIKNANIAMRHAKDKGKNQYMICSPEMKSEILYNLKMKNSLYRALDRRELYLEYQPKVDLPSGRIAGFEALARWRHPELGFIPPSVFIPVAEQTGLINIIGKWVIRTACEQNIKWHNAGHNHLSIAVNVSANQLRDPNLIKIIEDIISDTGLDPRHIELEITESVAMNEFSAIANLLDSIKKLGVSISIDDFGTDYSSLSRLKILPIDKLKIDRSFVCGIENCEKDRAIVRSIIDLSKNLDLMVIAEGVESESQLNFLKEELCDEVQGYYYYKPMSPDDISEILDKNL